MAITGAKWFHSKLGKNNLASSYRISYMVTAVSIPDLLELAVPK